MKRNFVLGLSIMSSLIVVQNANALGGCKTQLLECGKVYEIEGRIVIRKGQSFPYLTALGGRYVKPINTPKVDVEEVVELALVGQGHDLVGLSEIIGDQNVRIQAGFDGIQYIMPPEDGEPLEALYVQRVWVGNREIPADLPGAEARLSAMAGRLVQEYLEMEGGLLEGTVPVQAERDEATPFVFIVSASNQGRWPGGPASRKFRVDVIDRSVDELKSS